MVFEEILELLCNIFSINIEDITDIVSLKKGMTNQSFIFQYDGKRFIMRISGVGTEKLINRFQEYNVYEAIKKYGICDPIVYIDPEKGYKITKFLENSRVCNPKDNLDVSKCMQFLRNFHEKKIIV